MFWLGRFQTGDLLPLLVRCDNPRYGIPEEPDGQVGATIYGASGAPIETVILSPIDKFSDRQMFGQQHMLSASYSIGQYIVLFSWQQNSVAISKLGRFEVFTGDGDGAVIALHNTFRPEGRKLIYETDSGKLQLGRNPA